MNKVQRSCVKSRILNMVRLQSTGTPADLAYRFDISERTVKRLIRELRIEGIPLRYDFNRVSYVIDET